MKERVSFLLALARGLRGRAGGKRTGFVVPNLEATPHLQVNVLKVEAFKIPKFPNPVRSSS